jgi:hypothetical protein
MPPRLDTAYLTHLESFLPALCAEQPDTRTWLQQHREVVELLTLLDFESLRTELVATLPSRPGGRPPCDPVVLLRSVWLGVALGGGRWNAWGRALASRQVLRVLLGLTPDSAAPSIGSHYRFLQRILRHSDPDKARLAEYLPGNGHLFRRRLTKPASDTTAQEGVCEDLRRRLQAQGPPTSLEALDERLMRWTFSLGVAPLADAGLLPRQLWLCVDGTVSESHCSRWGHEEREGRMAQLDDRSKDTEAVPEGERLYSDPSATVRWSNGSKRCEVGHLGLGVAVRHDGEDLPLFSGMARPYEGETPAAMRMLHGLGHLMGPTLPNHRIRGVVGDAGFDARAFYGFCHERGWAPIVALARPLGQDDEVPRAADGTSPLCPGGAAMKFHERVQGALVYRCPAYRNPRDPVTGKPKWRFVAEHCPLGRPCSQAEKSWFLRLEAEDSPRRNLPVPRGSEMFLGLLRDRTSVERMFSGFHQRVKDRTYRRQYLWEFGQAMYVLYRQMLRLVSAHRERLDGWWSAMGLSPPVPKRRRAA